MSFHPSHGRTRGKYCPIRKVEEHIFERHGKIHRSFLIRIRNENLGTFRSIIVARRVRDEYLENNSIEGKRRKMGTGSIIREGKHRFIVTLGGVRIKLVSSVKEGEQVLRNILDDPSLFTKATFASGHNGATVRERIVLNIPKPLPLLPQPDIGLLVENNRKRLRMSKMAFARIVGISTPTVLALESGQKTPKRKTIDKIAKALELDVAMFYVQS